MFADWKYVQVMQIDCAKLLKYGLKCQRFNPHYNVLLILIFLHIYVSLNIFLMADYKVSTFISDVDITERWFLLLSPSETHFHKNVHTHSKHKEKKSANIYTSY